MRIIPYNGVACGEVRPVRFLKAFGREEERARIVAFGRCNYHCPYCRRDAQFVDDRGNVLTSREVSDDEIFALLEEALERGERIRLSGGDPCMHPRDSLRIAQWAAKRGEQISLCHNGSSPAYIRRMAPYLAYAAIDLKAINPDEYALRSGIDVHVARKVLSHFEEVCWHVLKNETSLLDVRTCVFSDTTLDDLMEMAQRIATLGHSNRVFWTIRQYNSVDGIDWHPLCQETLEEWIGIISEMYGALHIGCRLAWEGGLFYHWYSGTRELL